VQVLSEPEIQYVGITNVEDDDEDRAVVRIQAQLRSYVQDELGHKILRTGAKTDQMALTEYWTLARRGDGWIVVSIEQKAEGDHHLDSEIVASPWSGEIIRDEAITELAAADKLPEGFTTADLADFVFEEDAHAKAQDLALADGRFNPDVLEAAARRAVAAWAEAVDGEDAALAAVSSPEALNELLYGGDASRNTRLVVRGPRVQGIRVTGIDVETQPATMTVQVTLGGRRYVENRDTAAVVSGSKDSASTFAETWTLALDGPDSAPWRITSV
jgi:predicted lipid-binding transport protein (Tim44 family)